MNRVKITPILNNIEPENLSNMRMGLETIQQSYQKCEQMINNLSARISTIQNETLLIQLQKDLKAAQDQIKKLHTQLM